VQAIKEVTAGLAEQNSELEKQVRMYGKTAEQRQFIEMQESAREATGHILDQMAELPGLFEPATTAQRMLRNELHEMWNELTGQIDTAQEHLNRLEAKRIQEDIGALNDDLRKSIELFGLTGREAEIAEQRMKLEEAGIPEDAQAELLEALKIAEEKALELDALELRARFEVDMEPIKQFEAYAEKVWDKFAAGLIEQEHLEWALEQERERLGVEGEGPEQQALGAFSTARLMDKIDISPYEERTADATERAADILEELEQKASANGLVWT